MADRRTALRNAAITVALYATVALVAAWTAPLAQAHHISPRTSASFSSRPKSDALVKAAGVGDLKTIRKLLRSGVSPNADSKGDEGVSALSAASANGKVETVRFLLNHGADVNADDFWGGNALVGASLDGHVDVVKLLLSHGADPNMEDDGVTALDYASHQLVHHETKAPIHNYQVIVKLLRASGGRGGSIFLLKPKIR